MVKTAAVVRFQHSDSCSLTLIRWDEQALNAARFLMKEGAVRLLAAGRLVLPVTGDLLSVFLFCG